MNTTDLEQLENQLETALKNIRSTKVITLDNFNFTFKYSQLDYLPGSVFFLFANAFTSFCYIFRFLGYFNNISQFFQTQFMLDQLADLHHRVCACFFILVDLTLSYILCCNLGFYKLNAGNATC